VRYFWLLLVVFLLVSFRLLINSDETLFPELHARHFLQIYAFGCILFVVWAAPGYFGKLLKSSSLRVSIAGLIATVFCADFLLGISNATLSPRMVTDPYGRTITPMEAVMNIGQIMLPSGYEFGLRDIALGLVGALVVFPILFMAFFWRKLGRKATWRIGLIYASLMCAIPLVPLLVLLAFMGIGQ
jgi:hypothetical protein